MMICCFSFELLAAAAAAAADKPKLRNPPAAIMHKSFCGSAHLAHDLEVALLAVKHGLLAVGQALEVDLHDALKEGGVDGHRALVDGHSVLGVRCAVKGLQEAQ
jgi:hypothetical protein